ncbi:SpoIIE family protein phosphatase [Catalinimonas sp. 4WD22]|uniref:PP2C family protein-serine/threonine phosphatase n=1 Tax=Catalinimonas locisalis TaxID=3133978 RepID=UPI003100EC30
MISASRPRNEKKRLAALARYNILDSAFEKDYDELALLASQICDTPVSLVSFVDHERQWFKAKVGMECREMPREIAFCAHTIHDEEIMEIPNTLEDERFHDNPLVSAQNGFRFYAGITLRTPDGYNLGTLCVLDQRPRALTEQQRFALRTLGKQVIKQMELSLKIKEMEEANAQLEKQRKRIMDSINYGQRIQQAMLPTQQYIHTYLPNSFTLLMPKEVLSGDFYYCVKLEDNLFLAAVDCTGHGVPGAFMSAIGHELLNEIILQRNILEPAYILNELHERIVYALRQEEGDNRDGMEIVLCRINLQSHELVFSGAGRPLYSVKEQQLETLEGYKHGVGGTFKVGRHRAYVQHKLSMEKDTSYYLLSDGLQDQFGGIGSSKFGKKELRSLLVRTNQLPIREQGRALEEVVRSWTGSQDQIDDIMVLGFQL